MNVLIITAHPLDNSLCRLFSDRVIHTLQAMDHTVVVENLYENKFDPVLSGNERNSYYQKDYDGSAVASEIARLAEADALVLLFPTWWFGFPAILKGWFDRVWAPTVAYDHASDYGPIQSKLHKLQNAFVVTTLGAPWWVDYLILWRPVKRTIRFALLGACTSKCKLRFLSFYKCEAVDSLRLSRQLGKIDSGLKKMFGDKK